MEIALGSDGPRPPSEHVSASEIHMKEGSRFRLLGPAAAEPQISARRSCRGVSDPRDPAPTWLIYEIGWEMLGRGAHSPVSPACPSSPRAKL